MPAFLVEVEFAFLVNLIGKATKQDISPVAAELQEVPEDSSSAAYLGCAVEAGPRNILSFASSDMDMPFVSADDATWSYFELELGRRLAELETDESFPAHVRSALIEALPAGECGADDIAYRLGVSRRTFQRRLSDEGTTFQKQLNHARELLAKHYLSAAALGTEEIAYLLGYLELNSFLRAVRQEPVGMAKGVRGIGSPGTNQLWSFVPALDNAASWQHTDGNPNDRGAGMTDFELLCEQISSIAEADPAWYCFLPNASALIFEAMERISWAGFYLMKDGQLVLGPFQGKVACVHIPVGKGVCGTAAQTEKTQVVPDVHAFPGHIACDSASQSEIVVPIHSKGQLVGVLDIDSTFKNRFSAADAEGFEKVARTIGAVCDFGAQG